MALAGVFLVKYSIDAGYLTQKARVILGVIFGFSLLYTGARIHYKGNIANGARISQAISGAGIVVLYASIYTATSLYHILPSWLGFVAMAVVTSVLGSVSFKIASEW